MRKVPLEVLSLKNKILRTPQGSKTSKNFGDKYIFNLDKSGASISTVEFKSCDIRYKRGICRIKTGASIDNFIMDDCIVDSIGGYGVTNADNDAANFKHIKISNSSFSHCEKLLCKERTAMPKEHSQPLTVHSFII